MANIVAQTSDRQPQPVQPDNPEGKTFENLLREASEFVSSNDNIYFAVIQRS